MNAVIILTDERNFHFNFFQVKEDNHTVNPLIQFGEILRITLNMFVYTSAWIVLLEIFHFRLFPMGFLTDLVLWHGTQSYNSWLLGQKLA